MITIVLIRIIHLGEKNVFKRSGLPLGAAQLPAFPDVSVQTAQRKLWVTETDPIMSDCPLPSPPSPLPKENGDSGITPRCQPSQRPHGRLPVARVGRLGTRGVAPFKRSRQTFRSGGKTKRPDDRRLPASAQVVAESPTLRRAPCRRRRQSDTFPPLDRERFTVSPFRL